MGNILSGHIRRGSIFVLAICFVSCKTPSNIIWLERTNLKDSNYCEKGQGVSAEMNFTGWKSDSLKGRKRVLAEFQVEIANCGDRNITIDFPYNWIPSFSDSVMTLEFNYFDCLRSQAIADMSVSVSTDGSQLAPIKVEMKPNERLVFKFLANLDTLYSSEQFKLEKSRYVEGLGHSSDWNYFIRLRYLVHSRSFLSKGSNRLKWFELTASTKG